MVENYDIGPQFQIFLANFLLRMCRNGQNSTSSQIFNPKFEIPMGCFLFEDEFWWRCCQDLYVLSKKTAFVMQNFWNLEANGGEGKNFWTKSQKKAHAWLISRVLSH